MIYLSGSWSTWIDGVSKKRTDIGMLVTPDTGYSKYIQEPWAADNACFANGETFDRWKWLQWLSVLPSAGCLFAACPDVVGDWRATWERSCPEFDTVRFLGFPAAVVAQDGMTTDAHWHRFDALFVGGSTEWKLSKHAESVCKEAKRRGKWVHMGRVNSFRRLRIAQDFGCDSVDGTYLKFGPTVNWVKLTSWMTRINNQRRLF